MALFRLFYGWWIVAAVVLLTAYSAGSVFWSFSFLATPASRELGWGASAVSAAYLVQGIIAAVVTPLGGAIFDRFGPRRLMVGGVLLSALGMYLLGRMHTLWELYLGFTLAGMALNMGFAGGYSAVANWFVRRRGLAIGVASLGIAVAGGVAPFVVRSIDAFGWRDTYLLLGAVFLVLGLPLSFVLRRRPEDHGLLPDGLRPGFAIHVAEEPQAPPADAAELSLGQAVRGAAFWLIGLGYTMGYWAIGTFQVHQSSYLGGVGISTGLAVAAITGLSFGTIPGRIAFGWLADRSDGRYLTVAALALAALGAILLAGLDGSRPWVLALFLLFYAPGLGGLMVLQPAVQGRYFGRRSFGAILGVFYAMQTVTWSGGPLAMGLFVDAGGAFPTGFLLFGLLTLAGIPFFLVLRRPRALTPQSVEASSSL